MSPSSSTSPSAGSETFMSAVGGERLTRFAAPVLVDPEHRRQVEPVGFLFGHGDADVAGRVAHHERDQFGRRELGGEDQVAFVLTVLVVDHDDGLACLDVDEGAVDRIQSHQLVLVISRATYLASTSTSRLTGSPTCAGAEGGGAQRLRDQSDLEPVGPTAVTVSETPSTAIDPFSATYRASSAGSPKRTVSHASPGVRETHDAGAVDVALHDVAVQARVDARRAFEVHPVAGARGRRARSA